MGDLRSVQPTGRTPPPGDSRGGTAEMRCYARNVARRRYRDTGLIATGRKLRILFKSTFDLAVRITCSIAFQNRHVPLLSRFCCECFKSCGVQYGTTSVNTPTGAMTAFED
jgi:hypothetical protein